MSECTTGDRPSLKLVCWLAAACVSTTACGSRSQAPPVASESQLRSALLGSPWRYADPGVLSSAEIIERFAADGRWSFTLSAAMVGMHLHATGEGHWAIHGDLLVRTMTSSSDPDLVPLKSSADRVAIVAPDTLDFQDVDDGHVEREHRVPADR